MNIVKMQVGRGVLSNLFRGRGAELGVERGKYSKQIMETADFMYAIDIWSSYGDYRSHVSSNLYAEIYNDAIRNLKGKNVEFLKMFTQDAAKLIEDSSLDWIFVDAAHDTTSVYRDLTNFYDKVKKGGIIAGHDFFDRGDRFGVKSAVIDFCESKGIGEITEWCGDKTHSFHFLKPV